MIQLSELARQLNGQMDTRYAKMEQMLAEADQRIGTLEALLRKANGGAAVDIVVGDEAPAEPPAPPAAASPAEKPSQPRSSKKRVKRTAKSTRRDTPAAESTKPASSNGKQTAAGSPAATPKMSPLEAAASVPAATAGASQPEAPSDPRYGRVYAMADRGQDAVEIARQTGQTVGEIELILNLRKSRVQ